MGDDGLFGPGSLTWRVNSEGVLLFGGGTALIQQVAHPLVAAGVSQHSDYRRDPWGRLYRTLDVVTRVTFGSTASAEKAAAGLRDTHSRVQGESTEDGGARYPAGTHYDARMPKLAMWVHATLVRTSLDVYRHYVGPLTIAEQARYYEEQKLAAEMFGVPLSRQPDTYAEFNDWYAEMVASELAVTDALRDVVDATLDPPLPFVARPLVEALNLATVGMLPPRLREELALPWSPTRQRLLDASRTLVRRALPLVPSMLRQFPPARSARRRTAA
jgi:uncharacterized protein (DUF2236 family)